MVTNLFTNPDMVAGDGDVTVWENLAQNARPRPQASRSSSDAFEQILALADADGWAAVYDPANSDAVSVSSGRVVEIADGLGNLPPLRQNVVENRPAVDRSELGSLAGLVMRGGSKFLQSETFGSPMVQPNFVLAVAKNDSLDGHTRFVVDGAVSSGRNSLIVSGVRLGTFGIYNRYEMGAKDYPLDTDAHVLGGLFSFDESRLWVDDVETDLEDALGPEGHTLNGLTVGERHTPQGDTAWEGLIGPVLVYDGEPPAAVRERMTALLMSLAGIPSQVVPDVLADHYVILNSDGERVVGKNLDVVDRPASMTKVLTGHVARMYVTDSMLDDPVTVLPDIPLPSSAAPTLEHGDVLTWRNLFYGMMLPSHNAMANIVAYTVGTMIDPASSDPLGTFLAKMQEVAESYGWQDTVFTTASGLGQANRLSPRQVAELMLRVYESDAWFAEVMGTLTWEVEITGPNPRVQTVTNSTDPDGDVKFPEFVGAKTGSLGTHACLTMLFRHPASGEVWAAAFSGSTRPERFPDMRRLIDHVSVLSPGVDGWSAGNNPTQLGYVVDEGEPAVFAWRDAADTASPIVRATPSSTSQRPYAQEGDLVRFRVQVKVPYQERTADHVRLSIQVSGAELDRDNFSDAFSVPVGEWTWVEHEVRVASGDGPVSPTVWPLGSGPGSAYLVRKALVQVGGGFSGGVWFDETFSPDPDLEPRERPGGGSRLVGKGVAGLTATNGVAIQSTQWSKSRGVSARLIRTVGSGNTYARVTNLPVGPQTIVAWRYQDAVLTPGTSNFGRIGFGSASPLDVSDPAPNEPGETLLYCTRDENQQNVGLLTGHFTDIGGSVWYDLVTVADEPDYDGPPFSGATPSEDVDNGVGWLHEWDGTPNRSTSSRVWGQVRDIYVRLLEDLDAPAVGITVEGLSSVEASRIAIYRQTPGKERTLVQGLGNVDVDGAGYWVDYLPPLGVPVTYVVEVLEGDPLEENSATITIPSKTAWLQDALNPLLAVEVACRPGNRDTLFFTAEAFTAFERPTNSDLVQIMGGRVPVGMTSRRQTPAAIPFNMVTTAAEASSLLREVLIEGTHLVLRVPPEISMLDPVTYLSDVQVSEEPGRQSFLGGHVIRWNMTGSQTRGPRIMAWTALWTYDDVADLYAGYTYTDLLDGRRYVQWQASPDEAQLAGFSTTSGGGVGA